MFIRLYVLMKKVFIFKELSWTTFVSEKNKNKMSLYLDRVLSKFYVCLCVFGT